MVTRARGVSQWLRNDASSTILSFVGVAPVMLFFRLVKLLSAPCIEVEISLLPVRLVVLIFQFLSC